MLLLLLYTVYVGAGVVYLICSVAVVVDEGLIQVTQVARGESLSHTTPGVGRLKRIDQARGVRLVTEKRNQHFSPVLKRQNYWEAANWKAKQTCWA